MAPRYSASDIGSGLPASQRNCAFSNFHPAGPDRKARVTFVLTLVSVFVSMNATYSVGLLWPDHLSIAALKVMPVQPVALKSNGVAAPYTNVGNTATFLPCPSLCVTDLVDPIWSRGSRATSLWVL